MPSWRSRPGTRGRCAATARPRVSPISSLTDLISGWRTADAEPKRHHANADDHQPDAARRLHDHALHARGRRARREEATGFEDDSDLVSPVADEQSPRRGDGRRDDEGAGAV